MVEIILLIIDFRFEWVNVESSIAVFKSQLILFNVHQQITDKRSTFHCDRSGVVRRSGTV
jgi:hypothetical protein